MVSFYEHYTDSDQGPFDHAGRQKSLLTGLEALPVLLDEAVENGILPSLLAQLKKPILHLVRTLPLEWFTTSILKGMDGFEYGFISILLYFT